MRYTCGHDALATKEGRVRPTAAPQSGRRCLRMLCGAVCGFAPPPPPGCAGRSPSPASRGRSEAARSRCSTVAQTTGAVDPRATSATRRRGRKAAPPESPAGDHYYKYLTASQPRGCSPPPPACGDRSLTSFGEENRRRRGMAAPLFTVALRRVLRVRPPLGRCPQPRRLASSGPAHAEIECARGEGTQWSRSIPRSLSNRRNLVRRSRCGAVT